MAHLDDPTTQQANLRYIRKAMDEPMLEREHELKLARRWKNKRDEKALHELISNRGKFYDAGAVDACVDILRENPDFWKQ